MASPMRFQPCVVINSEMLECKTPAIEAPPGVNMLTDDRTKGWKTHRIDIGILLDGFKGYCNISNSSDGLLRQKGLLTLLPTPHFPFTKFVRKQELWYSDGMHIIYEVRARSRNSFQSVINAVIEGTKRQQ